MTNKQINKCRKLFALIFSFRVSSFLLLPVALCLVSNERGQYLSTTVPKPKPRPKAIPMPIPLNTNPHGPWPSEACLVTFTSAAHQHAKSQTSFFIIVCPFQNKKVYITYFIMNSVITTTRPFATSQAPNSPARLPPMIIIPVRKQRKRLRFGR